MNVVIRVDASIEIGTGHVMRCLTLAKQLKRHALNVTFICRELEGNSINYLERNEIHVIVLPGVKDTKWIQSNWKDDAHQTIEELKEMGKRIDLLIVDHYSLDYRWESMLQTVAERIMVIDDLADRAHHCDLLLDQNYYLNKSSRYTNLVPPDCVQMLGPDYILLRDEFLKSNVRMRTGAVHNIFIFFGGADPTGETLKTLQAIQALKMNNIDVVVVVGEANQNRHQIEKLCNRMPNTTYYCQVSNIAELMQTADLSIGAGGAITWERCLLGLPSITITIADNQLETTKLLNEIGATIYLGRSEEVSPALIKQYLAELVNNKHTVKQLSKKSLQIINVDKVKERPVLQTILNELGVSS